MEVESKIIEVRRLAFRRKSRKKPKI